MVPQEMAAEVRQMQASGTQRADDDHTKDQLQAMAVADSCVRSRVCVCVASTCALVCAVFVCVGDLEVAADGPDPRNAFGCDARVHI